MIDSRAAIRYARAILELAVERKATEKVEEDMRGIMNMVAKNEELRALLSSPVTTDVAKKKALHRIFDKMDALTDGLLNLLVDNRRIDMLGEVALKYIALNRKRKGEDVAHVTTAVPLTEDLERKVLKQVSKITGNKVTLRNSIDERIIGGFILRVGDLQYDASILNKLNNVKREFTQSL